MNARARWEIGIRIAVYVLMDILKIMKIFPVFNVLKDFLNAKVKEKDYFAKETIDKIQIITVFVKMNSLKILNQIIVFLVNIPVEIVLVYLNVQVISHIVYTLLLLNYYFLRLCVNRIQKR